jgi:hypothetical protein
VNDCGFKLKFESSFLSHTVSLLATLATMYSSSAVLWAMEPYFLLDQEIISEPNPEAISKVLFWFTVLPIQTEFVKPWSITPPLEAYLRICFTVTICKCFGSHMNWLRAFTA